MVMSQLMRQMTPEQRQQMMQGSGAFIELRRGPGTEDLHLAPAP